MAKVLSTVVFSRTPKPVPVKRRPTVPVANVARMVALADSYFRKRKGA